MLHAHYPLQALLYSVALHRYLRWRLPGYERDAQPRGRPLSLRPRHERGRARPGARPSLRRVVVVPTAAPGRGAERPLRPRRAAVTGREPLRRHAGAGLEGPLGLFNAAGLLAASDVHVAVRLSELAGLDDDARPPRGRLRRPRSPARSRLRRPRVDTRHRQQRHRHRQRTSMPCRGPTRPRGCRRWRTARWSGRTGPLHLRRDEPLPRPPVGRRVPGGGRPAQPSGPAGRGRAGRRAGRGAGAPVPAGRRPRSPPADGRGGGRPARPSR